MISIRTRRGLVGLVVALLCTGMVLAAAVPSDSGKGKGEAPGPRKASEKSAAIKGRGDSKGLKQLEQAKARVRAKFQERLNAALKAMVQGHKRGAPIEAAEAMADAGLQQGLHAKDFEPLGRFVAEQHARGLKGEALGKGIRAEVRRRQRAREQARQAKRKAQGEAKGRNQGAQKGKAAVGKQQGQGKGRERTRDKDKAKGGGGRGRN